MDQEPRAFAGQQIDNLKAEKQNKFPIPDATNRLASRITHLDEMISVMAERIAPICTPSVPEPGPNPDGNRKIEEIKSDLAISISAQAERILASTERLQRIIERVEL
jgi:hypothetical protein